MLGVNIILINVWSMSAHFSCVVTNGEKLHFNAARESAVKSRERAIVRGCVSTLRKQSVKALRLKQKAFCTQPAGINPFSFGNVSDLEILWNWSQCSACRWLGRYGSVSAASLSLLREMGGQYPENIKEHFPRTLYNFIDKAKVEDQVKFLVLTLDHIINLMEASVQWNSKTMEYFLKNLHRQSTELKECVDHYQKSSQKESYEIRINRHFRTLKKILKKEKYSAQAWEKIRRAVRSHLQRMDIIAKNANKKFLLRV